MLNRRRILLSSGKSGPDYSGAAVGDIFCTDGAIVTQADYAASGKTGVAVVLMNTPGEGKLRLIKMYKVLTGISWGPTIATVSGMPNYVNETALKADTSDSKANTDLMIAQYGTATTHVAGYMRALAYDGLPSGSFGVMSYAEMVAFEANALVIARGFQAIGDLAGGIVSNPVTMISAQGADKLSTSSAWMRAQSGNFPVTYFWGTYNKTSTASNYIAYPVAIIEY